MEMTNEEWFEEMKKKGKRESGSQIEEQKAEKV